MEDTDRPPHKRLEVTQINLEIDTMQHPQIRPTLIQYC